MSYKEKPVQCPAFLYFGRHLLFFSGAANKKLSFHVITFYAPSDIDAKHAPYYAEEVSGHKTDLAAYPPADPAEDCYAN